MTDILRLAGLVIFFAPASPSFVAAAAYALSQFAPSFSFPLPSFGTFELLRPRRSRSFSFVRSTVVGRRRRLFI